MELAAVSTYSIIGKVEQNLATTIQWIENLAKKNVGFILFPELNLSGYTKDVSVIEEALTKKEKTFHTLKKVSAHYIPAFAVGFPEKIGRQYFIAHFIFEKGKLVGIHRKTHLSPTEQKTFSPGNSIDVFQLEKFTLGIQLCFETHFPEISYIQAQQGANVLAMAFASPNETVHEKLERFKRFLCARAYDNACYVLACNLNGTTSGGTKFPELGMIINPKGDVLAKINKAGDAYCLAEFNIEILEHIYQSKMAHFNRFKRNDFLLKKIKFV